MIKNKARSERGKLERHFRLMGYSKEKVEELVDDELGWK